MSNSTTREGQLWQPPRGRFPIPFTEREEDLATAAPKLGTANVEIIPKDIGASVVRTYSTPSDYATYVLTGADHIDLGGKLPAILEALTLTFNHSEGSGSAHDSGNAKSAGTSASYRLSMKADSTASAAVQPDIQPRIKTKRADNVPVNTYTFYILGNVTHAAVLARLTTLLGTVLAWPAFNEEALTITLSGANASFSAGSSSSVAASISANSYSEAFTSGNSSSKQVGITTVTKEIPPTLHAAITLDINYTGIPVSAVATTGFGLTVGAGTPQFGGLNLSHNTVHTVVPLVSPTFFPATNPPALPPSGLYLFRVDSQEAEFGYSVVRAVVVDFASIV